MPGAFRLGAELLPHLQSALGICAIIACAWALSEDRRAFNWRIVAGTLLLQMAIALLLLKLPWPATPCSASMAWCAR